MSLIKPVAFLSVLLSFVTAGAQEFKGVLYKAPPGWEERIESGAKIFTPIGLKDPEMLAIILPPATPATADSHRAQFDAMIASANSGSKVLDKSEVDEKTQGEVSRLVQVQSIESPDQGKFSRMYAMFFAGQQRIFAMAVTNRDALLEKHLDEITNFFASIQFKAPADPESSETPFKAGKIPTGDTPNAYMGSSGFLPSGHGVPIPRADIVDGKPQGLWWWLQLNSYGVLHPTAHIYLPDGIFASNPRLGSGSLYDIEGQRRQRPPTGLGTFNIADGELHEVHEGFEKQAPFVHGTDDSGKFFKIDGTVFRPLGPATSKAILGKWTAISAVRSQYEFNADGTYKLGQIVDTGDWVGGSTTSGTYAIEGYLLMLRPAKGPVQIDLVGFDRAILMIGSAFHTRRK